MNNNTKEHYTNYNRSVVVTMRLVISMNSDQKYIFKWDNTTQKVITQNIFEFHTQGMQEALNKVNALYYLNGDIFTDIKIK